MEILLPQLDTRGEQRDRERMITLVTASWREVSNMKAWVPSATFMAFRSLWGKSLIDPMFARPWTC